MLRAALFISAVVFFVPTLASADVTNGPWIIDVTADSATVLFELPAAAPAKVTLRAGSDAQADDTSAMTIESASSKLHIVQTSALSSATVYLYAIRDANGEELATGSFRTAPVPGSTDAVRFLAYGDNRTDHDAHRAIVNRMSGIEDVRLLLHTGDMVETSTAENWAMFFDIEGDLLRRTPIIPALGNHELYGVGGRDLYRAYMSPARPEGPDYFERRHGPVLFVAFDSNDSFESGAQRQWLERILRAAREDETIQWIIASTHHSPMSSGAHDDHEAMHSTGIVALLREYEVDLIFAGHDHGYERGDRDGLKYVVAGGGGAPLYPVNRRHEGQLAFQSVHHFCVVDVSADRVEVTVLLKDGSTLEACGFAHGETWSCADGTKEGPIGGISALEFHLTRRWYRYLIALMLLLVVGFAVRRWMRKRQA